MQHHLDQEDTTDTTPVPLPFLCTCPPGCKRISCGSDGQGLRVEPGRASAGACSRAAPGFSVEVHRWYHCHDPSCQGCVSRVSSCRALGAHAPCTMTHLVRCQQQFWHAWCFCGTSVSMFQMSTPVPTGFFSQSGRCSQ